MENQFKEVSYGDGETNFFGVQSSRELKEKLENIDKFELRGLASKVGLNPNYNKYQLKEMILKEFKSYIGRNGPKSSPKQMFANASDNDDIIKMMESVKGINSEDRKRRYEENQKKLGN